MLGHLAGCPECEAEVQQFARVRDAVRRLPVATPPEHLTSVLRVIASQERSRRLARLHPIRHFADRVHLWIDNLMRPLALPLAGGLISAILLFAMLIPSFGFQKDFGSYDVPAALLFTDPAVKSQNLLGMPEEDFVVKAMIDGQGRVIDYTIVSGPDVINDAELKRAVANKLLFMQFVPATAFGSPTLGTIVLSFNRTMVIVKS